MSGVPSFSVSVANGWNSMPLEARGSVCVSEIVHNCTLQTQVTSLK